MNYEIKNRPEGHVPGRRRRSRQHLVEPLLKLNVNQFFTIPAREIDGRMHSVRAFVSSVGVDNRRKFSCTPTLDGSLEVTRYE